MSVRETGFYRVYIKDRLRLEDVVILETRCFAFNIKEDTLRRSTSSFQLEKIPNALNEGDVLVLYNPFGTKVYTGVIIRFNGTVVETNSYQSLFAGNYLYSKFFNSTYIERTVKNFINNNLKINQDTLITETFNSLDVTSVDSTNVNLPSQQFDYVINFEEFIYDLFDKYNIMFYLDVPFTQDNPTLQIKKPSKPKLVLADNTKIIPTINPITEIFENNKLEIYSQDGVYRETWYSSKNGITDDPSEITRLNVINNNIVFSDDPISILKAQNLRNDIYNHKIDVIMLIDNKLYNFWEMELGQPMEIFLKGRFYDTILTGYEITKEETGVIEQVKLIFGKVRTKASEKWKTNR